MERRDVVIVGSGPAGAATALGLAARAPALAARSVLLEKARHPRDKTCAGGVIPKAVRLLESLDVPLTVPQARVDHAGVALPGGRELAVDGEDLCRVVRRRELDAQLAWTARDRGVEFREEERVTHVARDGAGVRVETSRRTYWTPVLVGAAAGADPLMGEGISFALEYGLLAAEAICAAHGTGDWSFRGYARAVERGPLGRKLHRLGLATRLFYGPRGRLWFRLAALSPRAQAIGLAWYNGVDGWDRRNAFAALAALFKRF